MQGRTGARAIPLGNYRAGLSLPGSRIVSDNGMVAQDSTNQSPTAFCRSLALQSRSHLSSRHFACFKTVLVGAVPALDRQTCGMPTHWAEMRA